MRALWPGHPKPREDELLSSWIVRLAAANGTKLHTFSSLALPGHAIWNRDIDNSAKPELLDRLAFHTGTGRQIVHRTTLAAFEGLVFEQHNPNGFTPWVVPAGVYHRVRRRYGLAYCPQCLDEEVPYYRRRWRLAFATVCTTHACQLRDRCPICEAVITLHRGDIGDRGAFVADGSLLRCWSCRSDLRRGPKRSNAYIRAMLERQPQFDLAIACGYGHVDEAEPVISPLYFAGLRILTNMIVAGRVSAGLRRLLASQSGVPTFAPTWTGGTHAIELLPLWDRLRALVLVSTLLTDWPRAFLSAARSLGLTATDVSGKVTEVPFWLSHVVDDALFAGTYTPNVPEIRTAIAYLRRRSLPVTRTSVSRILGAQDALRKRQLTFLLHEEEIERKSST